MRVKLAKCNRCAGLAEKNIHLKQVIEKLRATIKDYLKTAQPEPKRPHEDIWEEYKDSNDYIRELVRRAGLPTTPEFISIWRLNLELKRLKNKLKREQDDYELNA
jgi:hypothetical protein